MSDRKSIRVVVAEDDYLVSEMIQGLLEELGYRVAGKARNGHQALELTRSLQPDVVLMDIQMPEMNGLEAAQQICQQIPTPVVALTAYETPELVERASQSGMGAYLIKPPNGREMERAITIAIARFQDLVEMRRLNATLQSYNEELDAFAHTVAHDLQSPLARINGFAELLLDNGHNWSREEMLPYLRIISRNAHKMSDIVEELLLLAGVRRMEVRVSAVAMDRIVEEALERLAHMVEQYAAEIECPKQWPTVIGYGPWIEAVWVNYLSNAIKYGGRPPRLRLGATVAANSQVRFWINDNGEGLSRADQARLFVPFTQLNHLHREGHGLGLSIVRRIVERLGGEVGVDSELGQGSTFWFSLPGAAGEAV